MTRFQALRDWLADILRKRRHGKPWAQARTLADLGDLAAGWLTGGVPYHPTYGGSGPDPETGGIGSVLAAANRAGFVTSGSQPGILEPDYDGELWQQRAAVMGFVAPESVPHRKLLETFDGSGMHVIALDPAQSPPDDTWMTVTTRAGKPYTRFGSFISPGELEWQWGGAVPKDVVRQVTSAIQVTIVDPEWGRNDVLWPLLEKFAETTRRT